MSVTARPTAQRGIGSVYGTSRERPFDRWFRYPAGFSAQALELAVAGVNLPPRQLLADPFLGSAATTSTEALAGHRVVGIETHPLIAHLATTKLAPAPGDPTALRTAAAVVVEKAQEGDAGAEHDLVRRCFDPAVLSRLAGLRGTIAERTRCRWRRWLLWALLGTLRDVATVKVGWPYQRPSLEREAPYRDPAARFLARAHMIADDLSADVRRPSGRVVRGDARSASAWRRAARDELFDGSVTSPPYLNNFDYADATRLELYFLGKVSSWAEMCAVVRGGMVVATTQQSGRAAAAHALRRCQRWSSVAPELVSLTSELQRQRHKRERGKEYDQVLPAYFADLGRVLGHLRRYSRPGALSAWVIGDSAPYGVYVDTPRLVGELASDLGFDFVDDVEVRSRGLRWRTNGTRHQVPLTERLITLRRK